ncbi:MAG: hypothetical protein IJ001_06355 [Oscillospiraceae bacterium]|nr:hypothetical protein [Oscillospiraceae bacterium]
MCDAEKIIDYFFNQYSIEELYALCPSHMLWEAIKEEDAVMLTYSQVLDLIQNTSSVFLFAEPLPALYAGKSVPCKDIPGKEFEKNIVTWEAGRTEPLYILNTDFTWMIALTAENDSIGEEVCALLESQSPGDAERIAPPKAAF